MNRTNVPPGRPRVYIAGPISKGDLADNVNSATLAFIRLAREGFAPFCPHWSVFSGGCAYVGEGEVVARGTSIGNVMMSHADWIGVDLPWVAVANAVVRLPGESVGADAEVAHAIALGIPVFDGLDSLIAQKAERGLASFRTSPTRG